MAIRWSDLVSAGIGVGIGGIGVWAISQLTKARPAAWAQEAADRFGVCFQAPWFAGGLTVETIKQFLVDDRHAHYWALWYEGDDYLPAILAFMRVFIPAPGETPRVAIIGTLGAGTYHFTLDGEPVDPEWVGERFYWWKL